MTNKTLERYHNDSIFRALVDQMQNALEMSDSITTSDIRAAALLASEIYESRRIRALYYSPIGFNHI